MTFFLGHVLFCRSMETFLVNFLKVFSQDHLRKRLLLNHNANQWYMNTQPNALYLLYPLRCQTETKTKEMWLVQSCAESKDTAPRAKGENWRWCYHNCCKETDYLFSCITHSAKVVFPKHLELNINGSFINIITTLEYHSDFTSQYFSMIKFLLALAIFILHLSVWMNLNECFKCVWLCISV